MWYFLFILNTCLEQKAFFEEHLPAWAIELV